ncbi:MAG: hypothetical protein Ct9H300mP16_01690 [Pseudomonadota bacterium]|nr:MAG: hypothetical protein Ct9H300mP16_01690 [Pseudomonadota bacterium]
MVRSSADRRDPVCRRAFYVSGIHAQAMLPLDGKGIAVKSLGETTGRASGIKMCYAALTKGTSTLQVALLTVAESLGLSDELREEFCLQPGGCA